MPTEASFAPALMTAATDKRVPFLGTFIDTWDVPETLAEIHRVIRERKPVQHCVLNAYKLYLIGQDPKFAEVVRRCDMLQADGVSIVWAAKILGLPPLPRIPGIDLMEKIFGEADRMKYRVFFLGATDQVLHAVLRYVAHNYPGIRVAGSRNGYFTKSEEAGVVKTIAAAQADVLLVAIPSPRKEFLLAEHLNALNVPFCMGVGGSFDVLAGKTTRAPRWVQQAGMEWLYRLLQEPGRLTGRYVRSNSHFAWLLAKNLVKKWTGGGTQ